MAKGEYLKLMTPLGKARYPKLEKQDTYDGEEVGYKLGMTFDDPKSWAVIKKAVKEAQAKLAPGKKVKGTIIRTYKDGNEYIEFKSYKKTPVFGRKAGEKLPEDKILGGGSIIRVDASLTFKNGYITGYMNGVQVAKFIEKGSGGAFDDLEGFDDDASDDESAPFDDVDGDED